MNQSGRISKLYYFMKKEIWKTASIACYFLCKNKGKITYTCNFPLSKKRSTQRINQKLMKLKQSFISCASSEERGKAASDVRDARRLSE